MNNTRAKILEVASDLVHEIGLNAMSYQDISDEVGIRKASIHHHFAKKENLVEELLRECEVSYGNQYQAIVDGDDSAPVKLRKLADVFEAGLKKKQLCLVGAISSEYNTLQGESSQILEGTIQHTVEIYADTFKQGREDGSLSFKGSDEEAAYAFFSFLVGVQIATRVHGGVESFRSATEAIINGWEI